MQHGHGAPESCGEPRRDLRRECDLGNEYDRAATELERALDQAQIDLGLARARHAVDEDISPAALQHLDARRDGRLLGRGELDADVRPGRGRHGLEGHQAAVPHPPNGLPGRPGRRDQVGQRHRRKPGMRQDLGLARGRSLAAQHAHPGVRRAGLGGGRGHQRERPGEGRGVRCGDPLGELELAAAGASVVVGYRSGKDEADAVADEAGGRAVQADVSNAEEAAKLVEDAGELDVLVNNAGLTRDGLLARMSDEDWRDVIETNLSSVFYTCRAARQADDEAARRRDRQRLQRRRLTRQSGADELRRVEGGDHRLHEVARAASSAAAASAQTSSRPGYITTRLTDEISEEMRALMLQNTPRPARRAGERGRGSTLPLLRRGCIHHGGGAARRRRAGNVSSNGSLNGRRRVVITGSAWSRRSETMPSRPGKR